MLGSNDVLNQASNSSNRYFELQSRESLHKLHKLATNDALKKVQSERQKNLLRQVVKSGFNPARLTIAEQNELLSMLDEKSFLHFDSFKRIKDDEINHVKAFKEQ